MAAQEGIPPRAQDDSGGCCSFFLSICLTHGYLPPDTREVLTEQEKPPNNCILLSKPLAERFSAAQDSVNTC